MNNINLYEENSDDASLEQFVLQYRPLVRKISLYVKKRLPSHVELDDILQSGLVGLLEARKTFKTDGGASFETYASIRIRGAIIDSLRKGSWVTRDTIKNMRRVTDAINKIEQRAQHPASLEEIGVELGVSQDELFKIYTDIHVCNVMSLDEIDHEYFIETGTIANPQEVVQRECSKEDLQLILKELPERDQQLLSLYYVDEFTFKQIGEIFNLTEARVCQLHAKLILKVRSRLRVTLFA